MKNRHRVAFMVVLAIFAATVLFVRHEDASSPQQSGNKSQSGQLGTAGFRKDTYSIDTPGSPWWIVNKKRSLPNGYTPADLAVPGVRLRQSAANDEMKLSTPTARSAETLFAAAKEAGYSLMLASGYRSQALQKVLYNGYVAKDGQAAADRYSAKPGTSEHQTGLAMDVCLANSSCSLEQAFGETPAGKWIAANAHKYGFIVRYLPGKDAITGYEYEPWHLRYVGIELATELQRNNKTMEEFFGL